VSAILLQAHDVDAQGGNISAFADPEHESCILVDDSSKPFSVYVVHTNITDEDGIGASIFSLVAASGFNASYLSETIAFPTYLGSLRDGISIAYGGCHLGPVLLATAFYQGHGSSEPCSFLDIGPHPTYLNGTLSDPQVQDCYFYLFPAPSVGRLLVNPTVGQCAPWCVVGSRETTWGGVKALYRE
jgi:hypothetical protein